MKSVAIDCRTFRIPINFKNCTVVKIKHYTATVLYTRLWCVFIMIPTQKENPKGLHMRYIVSKTSGEPVDETAEYFILRLDSRGSDPKHIDACRKAVLKYTEEIKEHLPELSKDLVDRYGF